MLAYGMQDMKIPLSCSGFVDRDTSHYLARAHGNSVSAAAQIDEEDQKFTLCDL